VLYVESGTLGIHRIASAGGVGSLIGIADASGPLPATRWPAFLPGGHRILFQVRGPSDRKGLYLGTLDGAVARRVVDTDFGAQYASGRLLWLTGTALMSQPFDPDTGQLTGAPGRVADPVAGSSTGYPAFSTSTTGVLAYSSGLVRPTELRWVDRSGRPGDAAAPSGDYVDFRLSPDGTRLAYSRTSPQAQSADVWLKDLTPGTEARLTIDPLTEAAPLWSPGGDVIIFRSNREVANLELYRTRSSPGGSVDKIFGSDQQRNAHGIANVLSTDWSPDGRFVVYHKTTDANTGYDLWALPLEGDRQPIPLARGPHNEVQGVVSPDGRWIAYASDESGNYEVYVQSFPDPSAAQKTTVSVGGGLQPRWNPAGGELFYLRSDGTLMAVAVRVQPVFTPGSSTPLFMTTLPTTLSAYRMDYVPTHDGKRFLMKIPVPGVEPPSITVVLNWTALLRK
jgi:hypothetical protein